MLFLKVLLSIVSFGFLAGAIGTVAYDIYLAFQLDRILRRNDHAPKSESGDATGSPASAGASSDSPSLAQPIVASADQCTTSPDSLGDRSEAACACCCHVACGQEPCRRA